MIIPESLNLWRCLQPALVCVPAYNVSRLMCTLVQDPAGGEIPLMEHLKGLITTSCAGQLVIQMSEQLGYQVELLIAVL